MIACVSQAVRPEKISTQRIDSPNCRLELCRKMFTTPAITKPQNSHDQEGAHGRQASLRRIAVDAKSAKSRRRDEEHPRDRAAGVNHQQERHRQADQPGEDQKQRARGRRGYCVGASAQEKHEAERREYDHPAQRAHVNRVAERRQGQTASGVVSHGEHLRAERDKAGDPQTQRHVIVDTEHIGAQALVYLRSRLSGDVGAEARIAVVIGHEILSSSGLAISTSSRRWPSRQYGASPRKRQERQEMNSR